MKTLGIIAEFNPFHNGHKYLIERGKEITGADNVIVICSGNFVQRGTPAIYDKYTRAKAALSNGADVVFELPVFYATASAELFARAAISFLIQLNCVDYLCFGCEAENMKALPQISKILYEEPPYFKAALKYYLGKGLSFPKARVQALQYYCKKNEILDSFSIDNVMSGSNNILALEYLKALRQFHSNIKPVAIKRQGAAYTSLETETDYASSTAIRNAVMNSFADKVTNHIPRNCQRTLEESIPVFPQDLDLLLGQRLLSTNHYSDIYGISEELSNRISNTKNEYVSFESYAHLLQSKNYTYAAISRALLHICLDIKKEDVERFIEKNYHFYLKVLAFKRNTNLLKQIKENCSLPFIGKLSDFYNESTGLTKQMLSKCISCDHLYRLIQMNHQAEYIPTEFEQKLIIE